MTQDTLTELLEQLEETGDVPPAWLSAHLPGADLGLAWAASTDLDAIFRTASVCAGRPVLVRAGCECARTTLEELRSAHLARLRHTLELTEAWCRGEATADAVRAAHAEIRFTHEVGDPAQDPSVVLGGCARTAVAAVADAVSFEYPEDAAASAARAARDAIAWRAVAEGGLPTLPLLGNDPRWVTATAMAAERIATLVRAQLPCPTLAQLLAAFDPG